MQGQCARRDRKGWALGHKGGTGFRLRADPERQEGQGAQGHKGRRVGPCGGLGAERSNGVF